MATTQLFVELLIIGIGAGIWFVLLLAAILGYRFDGGIPKMDTLLLVVLGGTAYVLGITVDRLARGLFKGVERLLAKNRLSDPELTETRERYILVNSEPLARQIQYNRSRLRICRSWTLNILLTLLTFLVWNLRVGAVQLAPCLAVIAVGCMICVLVATVAWILSADCEKNLRDSYKFLRERKDEMVNP